MADKRAQVHRLPTEDKNAPLFWHKTLGKLVVFIKEKWSRHYGNKKHLYFTTDEKIKEGDWYFINSGANTIKKCTKEDAFILNRDSNLNKLVSKKDLNGYYQKIVATTDKSLRVVSTCCDGTGYDKRSRCRDCDGLGLESLPQPSQAFIEKYCQVGGIDEVLIEYTYNIKKISIGWSERINKRPKIDSNNTITVKLIKYSWNRDELIDVLKVYVDTTPGGECLQEHCDEWISKNI